MLRTSLFAGLGIVVGAVGAWTALFLFAPQTDVDPAMGIVLLGAGLGMFAGALLGRRASGPKG